MQMADKVRQGASAMLQCEQALRVAYHRRWPPQITSGNKMGAC